MSKYRTIIKNCIILLFCSLLIGWIDPASDMNEEGTKLYSEEKHDEAISKFTDAQSYRQGSKPLKFNIANTQYKKGKFPEAEKFFKDVAKSKDTALKAKANYNMGNTMYKQGKFKESLGFYKKTLELSKKKGSLQDDVIKKIGEDAKYNYEFVQKKIEEMEKQQQERQEQEQKEEEEKEEDKQDEDQEQQKDDKGQEKKEDQQNKEDKQDQQDKQDEQKEEKEQQNHPSEENKKEGQQPPPPPQEKKGMSKEEAERILEALKQAERAARDQKAQKHGIPQYGFEKNW